MTFRTRLTLATAALAVSGAVSVGAQGDAPGLRPAPGPVSSAMPAALQDVRFEQKLDGLGIAFERATVPGRGIVQLFFSDPAGNGIELSFAASEGLP